MSEPGVLCLVFWGFLLVFLFPLCVSTLCSIIWYLDELVKEVLLRKKMEINVYHLGFLFNRNDGKELLYQLTIIARTRGSHLFQVFGKILVFKDCYLDLNSQ